MAPAGASNDPLEEAVLGACGWKGRRTKDGSGWLNGAVAQLREAGATPEEVAVRALRYRANYDGRLPTPTALVKQWAALSAESLERIDRRQLDRELAAQRSEQTLRAALAGGG
jgi:hypothetical protein